MFSLLPSSWQDSFMSKSMIGFPPSRRHTCSTLYLVFFVSSSLSHGGQSMPRYSYAGIYQQLTTVVMNTLYRQGSPEPTHSTRFEIQPMAAQQQEKIEYAYEEVAYL